jgi:hypothetical protein
MEELEGLLELNKSEGIYIDIGTQVYLEIEGVNFSATSIFIGMLKDEFMIFTLPKRYKSIKDKLLPSDTLVVKYLYEGSIYAFQTKVIETITNPIKALALGYPKVVQQRELRISKRNNVVVPGRIEAKKKIFSMVVFDISKKGCRFKYRENIKSMSSLREGDLLRIYCKFPGVADEIGAMACVKNIKRAQGQFTIGAEFQDMTKAFLMPLMQFLFSIEDFS